MSQKGSAKVVVCEYETGTEILICNITEKQFYACLKREAKKNITAFMW